MILAIVWLFLDSASSVERTLDGLVLLLLFICTTPTAYKGETFLLLFCKPKEQMDSP